MMGKLLIDSIGRVMSVWYVPFNNNDPSQSLGVRARAAHPGCKF